MATDDTNEILTLEELSVYLKVSKSTLYKLLAEGKVPGHKVGKHWRFSKTVINSWIKGTPDQSDQEI